MKGQIKRILAILFVVLFVATLIASAVSADPEEHWCGNEPHRLVPYGPISEPETQPALVVTVDTDGCGTPFPHWWPHSPKREQVSIDKEIFIENVGIASMK